LPVCKYKELMLLAKDSLFGKGPFAKEIPFWAFTNYVDKRR